MEAMDLYGRVSGPVQYNFSIPPPFYAAWYAIIFYVLLFLTGVFLFRKWWMLGYQRAESRISERMEVKIQNLAAEKKLSDEMVADILPERTVDQIRKKGKAKWDKYERATVLFSDIQGFTKIAEKLSALQTYDLISERAKRGSRNAFLEAMAQVPAGEIVPGDELPETR